MNAQDLKNSILQRAIEGKLVPQRKEEGTAKELLAKIRAEKAQLIKEKKIKKSKPLPAITDDEKPFDIPDSWEWVRLQTICTKIVDGDHNPPAGIGYESNYVMLSAQNINNDTINLDQVRYLDEETFKKEDLRTKVTKGDIFFTIVGTLGRSCIYEGGSNICFQRSVSVITTQIYNHYLKYVLDSYFIRNYMELNAKGTAQKGFYLKMELNAKGTAQKGFYLKQVNNLCIPVPPLAEQHRIVAKLEELQPDIDAYDKAQTKLQAIEQRFPDDMKKSLLQYAIEGKLVPQRKEEGTAKDLLAKIRAEKARLVKEKKIKKSKPLPAITDDEKPFDIPNSWEWTRFGDISINMDSERIPLSVTQRRNLDKIYDYYGASGVIDKVDKYLFDRPLMLIGEDGANLLARTKPIAFIARGKYWVNNHAHVIDFPNGIDMKYMTFYMNAINLAAYVTGTAQPKMNQARMNGILIAIPPITEQHRIVAKLEELLPLCDQLAHQS